jgi:L-amino acid N-acyltransferase YncA
MTQHSMPHAAADLDGSGPVNAHSWRAGVQLRAALRDGTPVCIRAVRPDDKERLRLAFDRLSPATVYRRFFYRKAAPTREELRMLTELDFRDHISLVVTVDDESMERVIAVGRFVRVAPAADRAELGVTVADEYQHRGAGTLLLQQLIALARRTGVRELVADVLDDNRDMLEVLQHLNVPAQRSSKHSFQRVVLDLAEPTRDVGGDRNSDGKAIFR